MIQSVDRALRILAVLQGDHRLSLGEIAQRLDLPPSTVHGIVPHPAGAPDGRPGARLRAVPPRAGRADAGQRLPRHPRAAVPGHALGGGPRPAYRLRRADRGDAGRRRRRRAPRAPARRVAPDARGRHRHPRPRVALSARRSSRSTRSCATACSPAGALRSMTGETITDPKGLAPAARRASAPPGSRPRSRRRCWASAASRPVLSDRLGGAVGAIGLVAATGDWPLDAAVVAPLRTVARSVSRELGAASWPPARARPQGLRDGHSAPPTPAGLTSHRLKALG